MEISKNRDIAELPPILRSCWIKLNSVFRNRLVSLGITPDQYTARFDGFLKLEISSLPKAI